MEFETENLQLQHICRTCEKLESQMVSVFEKCEIPYQNVSIDEMLMTCASIQVICGDGLPDHICQTCMKQLSNAFAFKQQCEKVDTNLRRNAKNLIDKKITQAQQSSDYIDVLPPTEGSVAFIKTEVPDEHLTETEQLLTCRQCLAVFKSMKALLQHQRNHRGTIHKCSKCDKEYSRLKPFRKHEKSHNQKSKYVCKICSKALVRIDHLKRHLVTHLKEKPFPCSTCNREFSRMDALQRHAPRCKRDLVYSCDMCNKAFHREDSLELHKKDHDSQQKLPTIDNLHNIKDHYHIIDKDVNISVSDNSDEDDCSESEVEQGRVTEKVAVNVNMNGEGSNVSKTFTVSARDKNRDSNVANLSNCLNNEEFFDIKEVKVENNLEEADDNFDSVKIESDVNVASNRFLCSECGKRFTRNDYLVIHMRRHSGEKPFKCKYCEKGFVRLTDVIAHERCHTGEKPHLCTVCGRSFRWAYNLRLHMKTHSKEKSYQCSYCDVVFTQSEDLENHVQTHGGMDFQCEFSKKFLSGRPGSEQKKAVPSFSKKKNATTHSKQGVKKKTHKCTVCGKEFGKPYYLTVHMKTHNRDDNYKTDVEGQ